MLEPSNLLLNREAYTLYHILTLESVALKFVLKSLSKRIFFSNTDISMTISN